jgi:hypothetical protein
VAVGLPHISAIPFTGNMHIPLGRVSRRKDVEKRFAKLKF